MIGRWCLLADSHLVHVCCALGFLAQRLARTLHSLVRVSRRGVQEHFVCVSTVRHLAGKCTIAPRSHARGPTSRRSSCDTPARALARAENDADRQMDRARPSVGTEEARPRHTALERLPFKQFQVLFAVISNFFSSFPHGTCSLSVSRPYLALAGIYPPLRAAIPNYSTLERRSVRRGVGITGLSPSMALHSNRVCPPLGLESPSQTTIHSPEGRDLNVELFGVQSPLLTKSLLFSFPPLNKMLQSSGSSFMI